MQIAAGSFSIPSTCKHRKSITYNMEECQPPTGTPHPSKRFTPHPQTTFVIGNHLANCHRCHPPTTHPSLVFTPQENHPKLKVVLITTSFPIYTSTVNNKRERIVKERDKKRLPADPDPVTTALAQQLNSYLESLHPTPSHRPRSQRTASRLQKLITRHKTTPETVKTALHYLEKINPTQEAQFIIRSVRELDRKYQRILLAMQRHQRPLPPAGRSPSPQRQIPQERPTWKTKPTCAQCKIIYVNRSGQTCPSCEDLARDEQTLLF